MKEKLMKLTKPLLLACMAFDFWVRCESACILFLGEYEHPRKNWVEKNN